LTKREHTYYSSFHVFVPHPSCYLPFFLCAFASLREIKKCGSFT
jgi:hypothetical protein